MTTIACDGKTIASDSLATGPNKYNFGCKLFTHDGVHYGVSASATIFYEFQDKITTNYLKPIKLHEEDDFLEALGLQPDGSITWWNWKMKPFLMTAPQACGSGRQFAMGAMLAGMNAEEAVKVAIALDPYTGGDVHVKGAERQSKSVKKKRSVSK